jgi:TPP-dependent pyruvate/acetoin dehydrogenase alpha subunit
METTKATRRGRLVIEQNVEGVSRETLVWLYRTMTTIRAFEERVSREFKTGEMPGFVHMYIGQEAVATGMCADLGEQDYITSTHRGHGHCIAKGCSIEAMMCELYGRETGLCKGRGGTMHIADFARGMLGASAIVGGGIPLATGGALAAQVIAPGERVAVCFFGDGAANQGVFHECLNLASIWKLPVVYVCENNGFAESTPASYATSVPDIATRATSYGIPGIGVDSKDVLEVYRAAHDAIARARSGEGPTLIEAKTYRWYGHFEGDPEFYRDSEERDALRRFDPIDPFRKRLLAESVISPGDVDRIAEEIEGMLDEAVESAKASPWPVAEDLEHFVYA